LGEALSEAESLSIWRIMSVGDDGWWGASDNVYDKRSEAEGKQGDPVAEAYGFGLVGEAKDLLW
jgi:hypothetical protein